MRFRKECWFESGQGHHSRFARTLPLALVGLGLRPICGTNAIGRRALLSRDEGQRRDVIGFRNLLAAERAGALDIVSGRKQIAGGGSHRALDAALSIVGDALLTAVGSEQSAFCA